MHSHLATFTQYSYGGFNCQFVDGFPASLYCMTNAYVNRCIYIYTYLCISNHADAVC